MSKEEVVKTRFILHCAVSMLLCAVMAVSASATELKVKGNLDVYGMWSANLMDHDSDVRDGDNYMTTQRMRTYFTYQANENLKAVLGLEMDHVWGQTAGLDKSKGATWGTDGRGAIEIKHAYLDFNFPDTAINVKAGLQYVALPSVFGHPVFDDDAAALVVSAPINDTFALAAGYTRGYDGSANVDNEPLVPGWNKDDIDMAFIAAPVTLDGFTIAPYFAYAWIGANTFGSTDDLTAWILGANAALTMFDPLTFAADLVYGQGKTDGYETKGWYAALAASYKMDVLTATLFGTYATGADKDLDKDNYLPTLREGWGLSPYIGGVRAFSTTFDSFATDALGEGSDGTGLWSIGLVLDDISFVESLSHKLVLAYAQGTGDKGTGLFTKKDDGWELYLVNKYMIYENLAAINELGYFKGSSKAYKSIAGSDLDASYFATVGFSYKF